MASVSSPRPRSYAPPQPASKKWYGWQAVGIVVCFAWAAFLVVPQYRPGQIFIPLIVGLFLAWELHLESSSLPWYWSAPLAAAVAPQLLLRPGAAPEAIPMVLGTGFLLYAMLWALAVEHSSRGLQAIATMALLLMVSFFTTPGCLLTGLILTFVMWVNSRGRFGRYSETAVLLLTPSALCVIVGILLYLLAMTSLPLSFTRVEFHSLGLGQFNLLHETGVQLVPSLIIAGAALFSRMIDGRTGLADITYVVLLIAHAGRVLVTTSLDAAVFADLRIVVLGGAMCLLAVAPPRQIITRLLVLLASIASLSLLITRGSAWL